MKNALNNHYNYIIIGAGTAGASWQIDSALINVVNQVFGTL